MSSSCLGPLVPTGNFEPPTYDVVLEGRHVTVAPVSPDHAEDLLKNLQGPDMYSLFDYLFDEPWESIESLREALFKKAATTNPWTYTILIKSPTTSRLEAAGMASLMRMDPVHHVVEVGSILYTKKLQQTPAATEAMYLLASYVFDTLGFRRYEWKCHSLNAPSRRAAERLGFTYEGTFRQHMILNGRNRDTAWFSMIDEEWPILKKAMEEWLSPGNFDESGRQRKRLQELRA